MDSNLQLVYSCPPGQGFLDTVDPENVPPAETVAFSCGADGWNSTALGQCSCKIDFLHIAVVVFSRTFCLTPEYSV